MPIPKQTYKINREIRATAYLQTRYTVVNNARIFSHLLIPGAARGDARDILSSLGRDLPQLASSHRQDTCPSHGLTKLQPASSNRKGPASASARQGTYTSCHGLIVSDPPMGSTTTRSSSAPGQGLISGKDRRVRAHLLWERRAVEVVDVRRYKCAVLFTPRETDSLCQILLRLEIHITGIPCKYLRKCLT